VGWLAREIGNGTLPAARAWAAPAGGEDKLLEMVTSSDADLAAGAVSALVWAAGGDDRLVQGLASKLRNLGDQSSANIKKEWTQAKRDIYALRLQRAAGSYRLSLRVGPAATKAGTPPTPGVGVQELDLGQIQLQADGQTVKLANQSLTVSIPETHMAIRLEKPGELKNFPNDQLAALALEKVTQPVDLLPQTDGSWRGQFALADSRTADLWLQPAGQ
jgi:hypothetical protein